MIEEFVLKIDERTDQRLQHRESEFTLNCESYQQQAIMHEYCMSHFRYINEKDQQNIRSCIKYVIQERQIEVRCCHHKSYNGRIRIIFNNFETDKMILKQHDNILVDFNKCKIGIIEFYNNIIYSIRDSYSFSYAEVEVLDYSQCSLQSFSKDKYFGSGDGNLLILPEKIIDLSIGERIQKIKFSTYNYLQSLYLRCQPQIICGQDEVNNQVMNLQKFNQLVKINIYDIKSDILLPNELESLQLQRGRNRRILNSKISSQEIDIQDFDIQNIQDLSYNILTFRKNIIKDLVLRPKQELGYIQCNTIENLFVYSEYKEINLQDNKIKNLVFNNKNIKILNLKGLNNILVDFNQKSANQIQQEKLNDCIDFSKFPLLNEITIETSKYFRSLDNYMSCPTQLRSISLINSYTLQHQENTSFDFSKLLNLQNVEIIRFKIKNVIMHQNKLKFEFDSNFLTSMQIKSQANLDQGQNLITNFLNKVNSLIIEGLKNLIINDKLENQINFQVFENLKVLKVQNIKKQILFPKSISELEIKNTQMVEFEYNFDFSNFEMLQSALIEYCTVDKFITKPNVQCRIYHCDINYLCRPFVNNCDYCFGQNTTVIKTFQQQEQQQIITFFDKTAFEPSYQRKKFNFKVKTLIINEPQILQKLTVCGMEQIIVNDHRIADIFDFTKFTQLTELLLINIKCQGLIFGHAQKQIKLFQQDGESKLEFLDFRNCQSAESSKELKYEIENVNVSTMYLGNHPIEHCECSFKYVQVCQNISNLNSLSEIIENYKGYCQYLVMNEDDSKQRILYQIKSYNSEIENLHKLYISQGMLLVYKLNNLYKLINQIVNE